MTESIPIIRAGRVLLFFLYDAGQAIDLDRAAGQLKDTSRPQFEPLSGQHPEFGYDPPPLRVIRPEERYSLGEFETAPKVELTVWDFGAVSVSYEIALPDGTTLEELRSLSLFLRDDQLLQMAARNQVSRLLESLGSSVTAPGLALVNEDYSIYVINSLDWNHSVKALVEQHKRVIAQILRQDQDDLSESLVEEALKRQFSRTTQDITVIDWSAALIIGPDSGQALNTVDTMIAVLEFTLVQLLELQFLDEQLDDYLDEAYKLFSAKKQGFKESALYRVSQLTVDASSLRESILNAINLLGSPTLSQIHTIAAQRFGLSELALSCERKVGVLDDIYEKLVDRRQNRRSNIMELIIILLILIEVIRGF